MLNIVLIDDHQLFLEGIKRILHSNKNVNNVYIFTEPLKAIAFLNSHKIDVLITDLNMPKMDGIDLIKRVKINYPSTRICVLTMYYNFNLISRLRELNIDGYLHKSMGEENFDQAIETINRKEKYFSIEFEKINQTYDLSLNISNSSPPEIIRDNFIRKHLLSSREFEVFILIINNFSSAEIATALGLSKLTVATYRKYIIKKIGCKTIVEFINYAKDTELINYPLDKILSKNE